MLIPVHEKKSLKREVKLLIGQCLILAAMRVLPKPEQIEVALFIKGSWMGPYIKPDAS